MLQVDDKLLAEMTRRIVQTIHPKKVVLFGSRARGDARPNSDYDFLVIQETTEPPHKRSGRLYTVLAEFPAEVEVLVYTPEEVDDWGAVPQAFVTTALREGEVLYEG